MGEGTSAESLGFFFALEPFIWCSLLGNLRTVNKNYICMSYSRFMN